jgi:hypothetical protein
MSSSPSSQSSSAGRATWIGFLVCTFVVCGLAGLSATFLLPVPLQGALLAASHAPDESAAQLLARFQAAATEEAATALRLRWLVAMVTITSAAFGTAILGAAARTRS